MLSSAALRRVSVTTCRRLPSRRLVATLSPSARRPTNMTLEQRAAIRAARKEQATQTLQQAQGAAASASGTSAAARPLLSPFWSRWMWYIGLGVPTVLISWGFQDDKSPPAQFSRMIGLSGWIGTYTDQMAKPSHDKLLPDWADIPNVPHDIPIPHTLVLDLEKTLVSSSWDRKYGWRHAKRPGVDTFLREVSQFYEIVLYSPSIEGVAAPVVESLDKEGWFLHKLFREATYNIDGIHVKDLKRLNRDVKRMVVLDDDPAEVQLNPENHIRIKAYEDPTDRDDNTLARITPFLIEIARENYNDIPALLAQFRGMDADEIADEHERRIYQVSQYRSTHGLSSLRRGQDMPAPELPPVSLTRNAAPAQLTAKQIAGQGPPGSGAPHLDTDAPGLMGALNRRAKEKEEQQVRKMEKWNQIMMDRQKQKQQQQQG